MNKKLTILFVVLMVCAAAVSWALTPVQQYNKSGVITQPGQLYTERTEWVIADSTLSAGDEPNDLAVDERTYLTILAAAEGGDSKITVYDLRSLPAMNRVRIRCTGITNDTTIAYEIYLGTLTPQGTDCNFSKAAQLSFVVGTQASTTATYELADAVTVTQYGWVSSFLDTNPGSNLVAEAKVDLDGADMMVLVPTTVGSNCQLLIKGN